MLHKQAQTYWNFLEKVNKLNEREQWNKSIWFAECNCSKKYQQSVGFCDKWTGFQWNHFWGEKDEILLDFFHLHHSKTESRADSNGSARLSYMYNRKLAGPQFGS